MNIYWWFKPHTITLLVSLPLLVLAALLPEDWFLRAGSPKYLDLATFTNGFIGLLGFVAAAWLASRSALPAQEPAGDDGRLRVEESIYRLVLHVVVAATLFGYVVWLWDYIVEPSLILPILSGQVGAMYQALAIAERIPGVTSLSNLGPLYVVLFALHATITGQRLRRYDKIVFLVFLLFAMARVFIYSERLAILELAIPFALIYFATRGGHRRFVAYLPVILVVPFVLFFAVSEYLRSWVNFYVNYWDSFWDFAFARLFNYYLTALNNGAGVAVQFDPLYTPLYTAAWFWRFPIELVPGGMAALFDVDTGVHTRFLYGFANPEFNNPSGLFSVFIDFGPILGTLVWTALGWITGRLYSGFTRASGLGLLLYPTWFVGVLEIPRVFTFGSSGYFPALVASVMVVWLFSNVHRQPKRSAAGVQPAATAGSL